MFLKPRKPSTDPRLRSLLQKAVRRGCRSIVERVATRLDAIGDTTWLRSRAVVITFEECWPLAALLSIDRQLPSKLDVLVSVAKAAKQKDAAGLGALAHAYREGDRTMLGNVPDPHMLRIVAEAVGRPSDFFSWLQGQPQSPRGVEIVAAASKYLPVATWEWDRACILAGALLTTLDTASLAQSEAPECAEREFPYWVALDKHTDEGKAVLREVAKQIKTTYRQLIWASFYCESAQVNSLRLSPWFDAERSWRFSRAGLASESAEDLWLRARPLVQRRLEAQAEELRTLVQSSPVANQLPPQPSLF